MFGHWPFRDLDLRVDPRVLIPRPETEQVVEVALGEARRLLGLRAPGSAWWPSTPERGAAPLRWPWRQSSVPARSTGSGPPTPARTRSRWRPSTWRRRAPAGTRRLPQVELVEGSWLDPLPEGWRGRVDLVVSNPPYVAADEWSGLDARSEGGAAAGAGRCARSGRDGRTGRRGSRARAGPLVARPARSRRRRAGAATGRGGTGTGAATRVRRGAGGAGSGRVATVRWWHGSVAHNREMDVAESSDNEAHPPLVGARSAGRGGGAGRRRHRGRAGRGRL